jgi:hypothetical protein
MSNKLIKFYKGVVLQKIHTQIVTDGATMSIQDVDVFLKDYAEVDGSTTKMNKEQLKTLVEWSLYFGHQIGCLVDYPQDKLDEQINLKIK